MNCFVIQVVEITENTVSEETEESPLERPKYAEYTPFQLLCDCLIRKLILKDPEEFFRSPVSASMAPGLIVRVAIVLRDGRLDFRLL